MFTCTGSIHQITPETHTQGKVQNDQSPNGNESCGKRVDLVVLEGGDDGIHHVVRVVAVVGGGGAAIIILAMTRQRLWIQRFVSKDLPDIEL